MRRNPLGQSTYLPGETGEFLMRDTVNVKGPPNRSLTVEVGVNFIYGYSSVTLTAVSLSVSRVQASTFCPATARVAGSGTNRIYLRLYGFIMNYKAKRVKPYYLVSYSVHVLRLWVCDIRSQSTTLMQRVMHLPTLSQQPRKHRRGADLRRRQMLRR